MGINEQPRDHAGAWRYALLVGAVALVANLAWLWWRQDFVQADSPTYIAPARGLLAGEGLAYRTPEGDWLPEYSRTPGYPAFLALSYAIRDSNSTPIILQKLLVAAMLIGWIWWLIARVGLGPRAALVGGLVCAVDPAVLHQANHLMTETLYTAILLAGFAVLWEAGVRRSILLAAAAGVLAAVSTLTRPISLLLFVPWGAYCVFANRKEWRAGAAQALAVSLVAVIPVLMWMSRNQRLSGVFSLSSISGTNMLLWRGAGVLAEKEGITFEQARVVLRAKEAEELARVEGELGRKLNGMELGAMRSRLGVEIIKSEPMHTATVAAKGGLRMFFGPALPERIGDPSGLVSKAIHALQYLHAAVLAFLAAAGFWLCWRRPDCRNFAMLAGVTVAYLFVMSLGPEAYSRFRVPVLPLMAAGVGVVLEWLFSRFARGN